MPAADDPQKETGWAPAGDLPSLHLDLRMGDVFRFMGRLEGPAAEAEGTTEGLQPPLGNFKRGFSFGARYA